MIGFASLYKGGGALAPEGFLFYPLTPAFVDFCWASMPNLLSAFKGNFLSLRAVAKQSSLLRSEAGRVRGEGFYNTMSFFIRSTIHRSTFLIYLPLSPSPLPQGERGGRISPLVKGGLRGDFASLRGVSRSNPAFLLLFVRRYVLMHPT